MSKSRYLVILSVVMVIIYVAVYRTWHQADTKIGTGVSTVQSGSKKGSQVKPTVQSGREKAPLGEKVGPNHWKSCNYKTSPSFDDYTCEQIHGRRACEMVKGRITEAEHCAMVDVLREFMRLAEKRNWIYWLHSGSLLGSWRHHGMIKWDTDLDIMVDAKNRSDVIKTYDSLNASFGYTIHNTNVLVFWKDRSIVRSSKYPTEKWPYVDMLFYNVTPTQVKTIAWSENFPRTDVFPLKKRPFDGMMVNAPQHTENYLKILYGDLNRCRTHGYNHKKMGNAIMQTQSCSSLDELLPHVKRTYKDGGVVEELIFKKKILHRIRL